jgi:hypothetical protein
VLKLPVSQLLFQAERSWANLRVACSIVARAGWFKPPVPLGSNLGILAYCRKPDSFFFL